MLFVEFDCTDADGHPEFFGAQISGSYDTVGENAWTYSGGVANISTRSDLLFFSGERFVISYPGTDYLLVDLSPLLCNTFKNEDNFLTELREIIQREITGYFTIPVQML